MARDQSQRDPIGSDDLLTFREAAALTNRTTAELRKAARKGRIAVRVVRVDGQAKLRLTPAALVAAKLLPPLDASRKSTTPLAQSSEPHLIDLVREQNERLARLEEQRFQLAGQLGMALERVRALEDRLIERQGPSGDPGFASEPLRDRVLSLLPSRLVPRRFHGRRSTTEATMLSLPRSSPVVAADAPSLDPEIASTHEPK